MTWEDKIEMVRLYNKEKFEEAYTIFNAHLATADHQAWDMFSTIINLSPAHQKKYASELESIHLHLKEKESEIFVDLGLKSQLRLAVFLELYVEVNHSNHENQQN